MIRRLIILLLIVGYLMPSELPLKLDIIKMNAEQKDSLYSLHDKNTLLAGYLNIIPSLGHAYMGKWIRGLSQYVINFSGAKIINDNYRYKLKNNNTMYYVGAYTWFWIFLSMQDVYYLSESHNAKLYKYIYDEKYPKKFNTSIVQKILDKIENNKKD
jgi:hypothetical protein